MSAQSRATRRASHHASWLVSLTVLAIIGIPLAGVTHLVAGFGWWFAAMGLATVSVGASWAVRACGLPGGVGTLAAFVAWSGGSILAFAPGTAVFGIVPTPTTINTLVAGFADAGAEIQAQSIPAEPVGSLVQLIAMSVGLLAVLADTAVVTRFPAFVGFIAVAVFTVPYAVQTRDIEVPRFVATTLVFVLLLWLTARRREPSGSGVQAAAATARAPGTALVMASTAVIAALVIPSVTPGLTADAFEDSSADGGFASVYGAGVDPVIQLGRDLRRGTPLLSLSYVTTAEKPLYLKLVDLSDFSEGVWQPDASDVPSVGTIERLSPPAGLGEAVPRTTVTSQVSIEALRSDWLPLPYPATSLTSAGSGWSADAGTGVVTLPSNRNDSRGDTYTVESLELAPTADQLASAGSTVPPALAREVQLPSDLPTIVSDVAREVTANSSTNYERAIALQAYFTSGQFEYSVETPVDRDFDGTNADALATFLEVKSGYCVHFAAAMATMARVLGIPARIAVGYFPSSAASSYVDGEPKYDVKTDQLHSWPELYFEGVGWLPFEPTPSLGISVPEYTLPAFAQQAAGPQAVSPTTESTTPATSTREDTESAPTTASTTAKPSVQLRGWLTSLGVAVGVFIIALIPAALRQWRRRRALTFIGAAPLPATAAWHELQDFARDYGIDVAQGDTPASFADRLNGLRRVADVDVDRVRAAVEREHFADSSAMDATQESREAIRASLVRIESSITSEAETAARRRARWLPTSLFVRAPRP